MVKLTTHGNAQHTEEEMMELVEDIERIAATHAYCQTVIYPDRPKEVMKAVRSDESLCAADGGIEPTLGIMRVGEWSPKGWYEYPKCKEKCNSREAFCPKCSARSPASSTMCSDCGLVQSRRDAQGNVINGRKPCRFGWAGYPVEVLTMASHRQDRLRRLRRRRFCGP